MTNLDRWHLFMRDIESPDIYIDWGFYHMISSALQRRVWMHSDPTDFLPCSFSTFPNIYAILVGPPSTGKGRVILQESSIIRANELMRVSSTGELIPLLPCAPDKITLEKLVQHVAGNVQTISRDHPVTKKKQTYGYCPCSFLVEELEVLFCENTNDMVNVINKCWDAQDLTYETKHQGSDHAVNVCMSLIAGTTPDGIKDLMCNKILKKGMTSRCIFIYADKPRFFRQFPGLDPDQQQARRELIQHIKALTTIFCEVKMSSEAKAYDKEFYESGDMFNDRLNKDSKLDDYYGRKRLHWLKLAMILLYADQTASNIITLDILKRAYQILKVPEVRMHETFQTSGKNILYEVCLDVERYLEDKGRCTYKKLWWTFSKDVNKQQFDEIINLLVETGRVRNNAGELALSQGIKKITTATEIITTNERQDSLHTGNGAQQELHNGEPVSVRLVTDGIPDLTSGGMGQLQRRVSEDTTGGVVQEGPAASNDLQPIVPEVAPCGLDRDGGGNP